MDVDAIQKLTEKLNLLEQRLTREHPHLHNMKDKSLSNENSNIEMRGGFAIWKIVLRNWKIQS